MKLGKLGNKGKLDEEKGQVIDYQIAPSMLWRRLMHTRTPKWNF
jgi:hypothetical protein